jgi:hypothetical protein
MYGSTVILLDLGSSFSFLILYTDIHALSGIRTQTPVLERAKTVHALDSAVTVIGRIILDVSNTTNRIPPHENEPSKMPFAEDNI